ncbi:hypothetical protein TCAL_13431 [Tigriopus californicus]|uniref:C2H2-type domain-containing protein n=1 Tax=Tigriopus californicus TaxID=6832 RepID=A0A553PTD6_TIGCA|nr:uncharacterized protein LOC131891642 [Tigriopus californicus]TRY80948.1 hypothetical protein TCAL_13431 [Tigriopus californicus]|eukprot:TCALIF_13431-PA protein Name:"Protein of unknown function" AED:0.00 eAED:0.00 QI:12/1/1/1/1/1/4/60/252
MSLSRYEESSEYDSAEDVVDPDVLLAPGPDGISVPVFDSVFKPDHVIKRVKLMKNKLYRRDQIICLICTSSFCDIESFNQHHYNFHELQQIFCEICGKEMKSLKTLRCHIIRHNLHIVSDEVLAAISPEQKKFYECCLESELRRTFHDMLMNKLLHHVGAIQRGNFKLSDGRIRLKRVQELLAKIIRSIMYDLEENCYLGTRILIMIRFRTAMKMAQEKIIKDTELAETMVQNCLEEACKAPSTPENNDDIA